jgi:hypothetical protein
MASPDRLAFTRILPTRFLTSSMAKKVIGVALLCGASLILSVVLLLTNGSLVASIALLGLIVVVLVTLYRVDWGFYLFIFMVFFFDQYSTEFSSFTDQVGYFNNFNAISYLPTIKEGVLTPMELQLALLFFVWVLVVAVRKNVQLTPVAPKLTATMFFLALIGSLVHGLATGGDLVVSLWETRALFYLGIMFVFVPQIIQTREQLQTLIWFCIAGIAFKAFQGAERYAALGFTFGYWPHIYGTLTNHEDPVFIITLIILLIGLSLFASKTRQRTALLMLLPVLVLGYVAGQRRAAFASFMATLFAFIILLPKREKQIILKVLVVLVAIFGLYLAAFWNSSSRVGAIAQEFKATVTGEGGIRGEYKDRSSTLYRDYENYNLAYTFRAAPLEGVGFGKPYDRPLFTWGGTFPLAEYLPHNQILWIFVKMGVVGGLLFWLFFNSFVFRGAMIFSRIADPYLKAVCAVCIVAVINQLVVSFVDMQLAWYRNMVYLGMLMGLVPVLERLAKSPTQASQSSSYRLFDPSRVKSRSPRFEAGVGS